MNATQLTPTQVSNLIEAGNAAFDGVRRRPVACFTPEGLAVVCCGRTAKKNGWVVVGRLFKRDRKAERAARVAS
jgi:hypothetical protein